MNYRFFYARTSTALRTYVLTPYARTFLLPMDVRLQIYGRTSIENDYKTVVIFDYYLSENSDFFTKRENGSYMNQNLKDSKQLRPWRTAIIKMSAI